jgi:hypothetical protein
MVETVDVRKVPQGYELGGAWRGGPNVARDLGELRRLVLRYLDQQGFDKLKEKLELNGKADFPAMFDGKPEITKE